MANSIARTNRVLQRDRLRCILGLLLQRPWLIKRDEAVVELQNVCPSDASFELAIELLYRFTFFEMQDSHAQICALAGDALANFLHPETTVFTCLSDPRRVNSGLTVLNWVKNHLATFGGWEKEQFHSGIATAVYKVPANGHLVLVDDFVGSGTTLVKKCDYAKKTLAARGIGGFNSALLPWPP